MQNYVSMYPDPERSFGMYAILLQKSCILIGLFWYKAGTEGVADK